MKPWSDAFRGAMVALKRRADERNTAKQRFIDGGGECFDCLDTGWTNWRVERHDPRRACAHCTMGRARLAEMRGEVVELLTMESPLTPLAMPLEGMRAKDAEGIIAQLHEWVYGWPESWREVGPQERDQPFLLLHGLTGSGKTTTAATVANMLGARSLLVPNYVNAKEAIDVMRDRGHGRDTGPYQGEGTWRKPAPLLVDDLAVATHSEASEAFHYSVVQARYERKWPTIFTTNASLEPNGGDRTLISRIGARAYWRIKERSLIIEMGGYNWRDSRYTAR